MDESVGVDESSGLALRSRWLGHARGSAGSAAVGPDVGQRCVAAPGVGLVGAGVGGQVELDAALVLLSGSTNAVVVARVDVERCFEMLLLCFTLPEGGIENDLDRTLLNFWVGSAGAAAEAHVDVERRAEADLPRRDACAASSTSCPWRQLVHTRGCSPAAVTSLPQVRQAGLSRGGDAQLLLLLRRWLGGEEASGLALELLSPSSRFRLAGVC